MNELYGFYFWFWILQRSCLAYWLGKLGLYIWIPISIILANISVTKNVMIFGIEATLGNIVYATSFLVTDILSEIYGKKESAKAVKFGFFASASMTVSCRWLCFSNPLLRISHILHSGHIRPYATNCDRFACRLPC